MTTFLPRRAFEPGLYITLFADASYCSTTKAYGWCWWIKYGSPPQTKIGVGGGANMQGSHLAEVEALRAGMAFLYNHLLDEIQEKRIVIQSDCTGALEAIKPDLNYLQHKGADMAYTKHVKGHRGHSTARSSVNTLCDRKAKEQMKIWRQKSYDNEAKQRPEADAGPRPRSPGF